MNAPQRPEVCAGKEADQLPGQLSGPQELGGGNPQDTQTVLGEDVGTQASQLRP